jgi:hypothetical protein
MTACDPKRTVIKLVNKTTKKRLSQCKLALLACLLPHLAAATGQISDVVHYGDKTYGLIGLVGALPDPTRFGIEPVFSSTANWRGYFSEYSIIENRLVLTRLTVNAKSGEYPTINGIEADLEIGKDCFEHKGEERCHSDGGVYVDVGLDFSFTGKIRIATDFIDELYVHMGFQKPSAFGTVIDLSFEDGLLVSSVDRSEDAAEIRGKFRDEYYGEGQIPEDAVSKAFSLQMEPLQ